MHGVNRMHEQSWSPSRTQGGGDLARNDATLAHARDHHPPSAGINQPDREVEGRSHGARNAVSQSAQSLSLDANYVFANVLHGRKQMLAEDGRQHLAVGNPSGHDSR
jgi:hypothetical protein